MSESIMMISTAKLHPHPLNPRQHIGDVTELAESIKAQGIMQNLTVVRDPEHEGEFRVLIGHRRLAAAQQAGLKELPCAIVGMSKQDQIAVMMSENMQRADLTMTEQIMGVKSLLDLCETEYNISKMTGLSKRVVGDRAKVAKGLKTDQIIRAETTGATLLDMLNLAKLPEERREAAFKSVESGKLSINEAISVEANEIRKIQQQEKMRQTAQRLGIQIVEKTIDAPLDEGKYWDYTAFFTLSEAERLEETVEKIRKDDPDKQMCFTLGFNGTLYKQEDNVKSPCRQRNEQREKAVKNLAAADERFKKHVKEFVLKDLWKIATIEEDAKIVAIAQEIPGVRSYENMTEDEIADAFGIEKFNRSEAGLRKFRLEVRAYSNIMSIMVMTFQRVMNADDLLFYNYRGEHKTSYVKKTLWTMLNMLGFSATEEELQLMDGTHPDFMKE